MKSGPLGRAATQGDKDTIGKLKEQLAAVYPLTQEDSAPPPVQTVRRIESLLRDCQRYLSRQPPAR